jgi:hypothetical protein
MWDVQIYIKNVFMPYKHDKIILFKSSQHTSYQVNT